MTTRREKVLPVGQQVDFYGKPLFIEKLLNSGFTGEVYQGSLEDPERGNIKVAIKAMKALDLPMALKLFGEECVTLGLMMGYEEAINKEQGFLFKIAPIYYGKGEVEKVPYFVMEFIEGQKIPKLLEENARLPELQALTVAWHLYHTLEIMHRELKKTYIDLKFENLWWVENNQNGMGQLKLTDFGTLEDIREGDIHLRGIKRDILLGAVFLCKMLTGYTPRYSLGDLLDPAGQIRQILDQADISWGARWLLRRLLHSNPDIRLPLTETVLKHPNAGDLRLRMVSDLVEELEVLVGFWVKPQTELLKIGQANLNRAEALSNEQPLEARKRAERARMALDIFRLRQPTLTLEIQDDLKRTENLLALTSHLQTGRALFSGRAYTQSRKTFAQGLSWYDEPAVLRRWAYLSRIGEDISPELFDPSKEKLVEAVERLNEAKWKFALDRLQDLKSIFGSSTGFESLVTDAQLFQALELAHQSKNKESYGEAATLYRKALSLLTNFPKDDLIPSPIQEVGDLLRIAEEMESAADNREKSRGELDEVCLLLEDGSQQLGNQEALLKRVTDAFHLDRVNSDNFKKLDNLSRLAVSRFQFKLAIQLAEIGLTVPNIEFPTTLHLARQLNAAQMAWKSNELDTFILALSDIWSRFSNDTLTLPAIYDCLDEAKKSGVEAQNSNVLLKLAEFVVKLPDGQEYAKRLNEFIAGIQTKETRKQQQFVDKLVGAAEYLLTLDRFDHLSEPTLAVADWTAGRYKQYFDNRQTRLKDAFQFINDAQIIDQQLGENNSRKISELKGKIERELELHQEEERRNQTTRLERQKELQNMIESRWKQLSTWHQQVDEHPNPKLDSDLQKALPPFIYHCYTYLAFIGDDSEVKGRVRQASEWLTVYGEDPWGQLKQEAEEHIKRVKQKLEQAQMAFDSGNLDEATALIDRLALSVEGRKLQEQINQVRIWKQWQSDNNSKLQQNEPDNQLLIEMRRYLSLALPPIYWQDSKATTYLTEARKRIQEKIKEQFWHYQNKQFITYFRLWLKIEWLLQRIPPIKKPAMGEQKPLNSFERGGLA